MPLDAESTWAVTATSCVGALNRIVVSDGVPANVDATGGVTVYCSSMTDANGEALTETYALTSSATLQSL
ncbi:MAG: hypothetical protein ACM3VT_13555 [Solirubrobacterales bacterium]